jgi:hypothetical protein
MTDMANAISQAWQDYTVPLPDVLLLLLLLAGVLVWVALFLAKLGD